MESSNRTAALLAGGATFAPSGIMGTAVARSRRAASGAALGAIFIPGSGVSARITFPSPSLNARTNRTLLLQRLRAIQTECSLEDWDGDGAEAIGLAPLDMAIQLLAKLPQDIPEPDPGAEPDGGLSLEWYARDGRYISVSVGPSDRAVGIDVDGDQIESWSGYVGKDFAADLAMRIRALGVDLF